MSRVEPIGTLVPTNMRTATSDALANLEASVGKVVHYVASELGYAPGKMREYWVRSA